MTYINLNTLNKVRDFVRFNQVTEAFQELFNICKENERQDEVVVLSSSFQEIEKRERMNIISFQESNLLKNKIRFSILGILREIQKENTIQDNFKIEDRIDYNPSGNEISIKGLWRKKLNDDFVFFQQKGNAAIGIYDFNGRRKVGIYQGVITGSIFEYRWKWATFPRSGFGEMTIDVNNLISNWWFFGETKPISQIHYEYVGEALPNWIELEEFHILWKKFTPI